MNHEFQKPDDGKLRAILRESRPAPALPPRFQEAVWRRIERAEAPAEPPATLSWLDLVVERLLRPRLALAGLSLLLLAGVITGVLSNVSPDRQAAQARYLAAVAPNSTH
jgi:hypothetical protein